MTDSISDNQKEPFAPPGEVNNCADTSEFSMSVDIAAIKPKNNRKGKNLKILLFISIILTVAVSCLIYYIIDEKNIVARGTSVNIGKRLTFDIGGKNYTDAIITMNEMVNTYLDSSISLSDSSKITNTQLKDIGVSINSQTAEKDIENNIYGPYIYDSVMKHLQNNIKIPIIKDVTIDKTKFDMFINNSLAFIEKPAQDASLSVDKKGELLIAEEVIGTTIDKEKLKEDIISAVKENTLEIKIPVSDVIPKVTEASIKNLMPAKLISTFSSNYGGSDGGRKENIRLGASFINNILLKPGEEFEFWKYMGEPVASRGFKPATIYQNGKVAIGIGGGLCQVSTTLYNSALLADLSIVERSPHGLPVHYVPLGLDATVAIGSFTLRFVNNTEKYLLIKSNTDRNIITFSIYGDIPEGKSLKVYSKIIGHNTADAYRDVYMNGTLIRHDFLGRSNYKDPSTE